MQVRQPNAGDYGLLLLLAAIWGSSFAFIKMAVDEVPPVTLTGVRLSLAALVMLALAQVRGAKLPDTGTGWALVIAAALAGNAIPFSLIAWGELEVPSNTAAILMGIMPLLTLLLAHVFTDDDKLNTRKALGMLTGFAGLLVLVGPAALGGLTVHFVSQLAILGAAMAYGVNAILVRKMQVPDMTGAIAMVLVLSAIMVMGAAFVLEDPLAVRASAGSWWAVVTLGLVHTALATMLMFKLVGRAGATFFSQLNLVVPMFGVVWGLLLLAEVPGINALAALALIVLGIMIARGGLALTSRTATESERS